jgi:hypothetical protein
MDKHCYWTLGPDPHYSDKLNADPYESKKNIHELSRLKMEPWRAADAKRMDDVGSVGYLSQIRITFMREQDPDPGPN